MQYTRTRAANSSRCHPASLAIVQASDLTFAAVAAKQAENRDSANETPYHLLPDLQASGLYTSATNGTQSRRFGLHGAAMAISTLAAS